uniref:Uncharacterized protein n=1 Tax=Oryctolagus cuniculus TaxID=9986 RepID=A0A5F9C752_RABIT
MMKGISLFGKCDNKTHTSHHHHHSSKAHHLQKETCGKCAYITRYSDMGSVKEQHQNPRRKLLQPPVHFENFNN